ncbi:FkbM family methyltransferase [Schleiferiaceae bacterium]|nr:FkbM family methyltransferase [Schleiferiaceae bacterium]
MLKKIIRKHHWLYYQLISLPFNKQKRVDIHISRYVKGLSNGVFLDIGSNVGKIGYLVKGKSRLIVGVEPLNHLYNYCVDSGSYGKMFNCALGSEIGKFTLKVPITNGRPVYTRASLEDVEGNDFLELEVKVDTADRIFQDIKSDIRFIKIDVEGHEEGVLRGFSLLNEMNGIHVIIELELRHGDSCLRAVRLLKEYGFKYSGFIASKGKVDAREMDLIDFLSDPIYKNEYVNNFCFYK